MFDDSAVDTKNIPTWQQKWIVVTDIIVVEHK